MWMWGSLIIAAAASLAFISGAIDVTVRRPGHLKWIALNTFGAFVVAIVWAETGGFTTATEWVIIGLVVLMIVSARVLFDGKKADPTPLRPA